jgi:hypothetical protein
MDELVAGCSARRRLAVQGREQAASLARPCSPWSAAVTCGRARLYGARLLDGSWTSRGSGWLRWWGAPWDLRLRARGDLIMVDQQQAAALQAGPAAVVSCWLCGLRLSAAQMVADGGGACADVRWFCRDIQGCTDRWTSRTARVTGTTPAAETGQRKRAG